VWKERQTIPGGLSGSSSVSKSLEMALEELNLVALVGMPWMGDKGQSISVLSAGGGQPIVSISIILI